MITSLKKFTAAVVSAVNKIAVVNTPPQMFKGAAASIAVALMFWALPAAAQTPVPTDVVVTPMVYTSGDNAGKPYLQVALNLELGSIGHGNDLHIQIRRAGATFVADADSSPSPARTAFLDSLREFADTPDNLAQITSRHVRFTQQSSTTVPAISYREGIIGPLTPGVTYDIRLQNFDVNTLTASAWVEVLGTRIPNPAGLSALTISAGALVPAFDRDIKTYTASVVNSVTGVTLTPTEEIAGAAISVKTGAADADAVASGSASAAQSLIVGENTITIGVTAATAADEYVVKVTRVESMTNSVGLLESLVINDGASDLALTKTGAQTTAGFAADHGEYSAPAVLYAVENVTLTPTLTAASSNASITVAGGTVESGMSSESVGLTIGANTITIRVTAEDASIMEYTVAITRGEANTVNSLSALVINDGTNNLTLTKTGAQTTAGFAAAHLEYETPNVLVAVNSVTVTATIDAAAIGATVSGDGANNLNIGANTLNIVVTAEDQSTQTYSVAIFREPDPSLSGDASLTALRISRETAGVAQPDTPFYPAVTPGATAYTARASDVVEGDDGFTLHITAAAGGTAVVTAPISGYDVFTGSQYAGPTILPRPRFNANLTITITSENKLNTSAYTLDFEFTDGFGSAFSANANLSALAIAPGMLAPEFRANQTTYTARVANSVATLRVTANHADSSDGFINIDGVPASNGVASGEIMLAEGAADAVTIIPVISFAPDIATTKTYTLAVTRAGNNASTDASLTSLAISTGELVPEFSAEVLSYDINLRNVIGGVDITAAAADSDATVDINGAAKNLTAGENKIEVVVTAADVFTTQTYLLNINRAEKFDMNVDASTGNPTGNEITAADAIIIARYLLGVTGGALIAGQLAAATADADITALESRIKSGKDSLELDVTADDTADGDDGIMIARYVFGLREEMLTADYTADAATVTMRIEELLAP